MNSSERKDFVLNLWEEGKSAREIAEALQAAGNFHEISTEYVRALVAKARRKGDPRATKRKSNFDKYWNNKNGSFKEPCDGGSKTSSSTL